MHVSILFYNGMAHTNTPRQCITNGTSHIQLSIRLWRPPALVCCPTLERHLSSIEFLEGPLRSMVDLLICQTKGLLFCSADLHTEGPLLCSDDLQTISSFVAGLLHSCSVTAGFLTNLQVPADAGLRSLSAARQGLYVSVGLHVSAADRHGLQVLVLAFIATVGLHVFADVASRPGS
ncbi:hypothetical protein GOODEAATRI_025177 [Goodea atripinnis]|uniref:Uncharacterized protein n=1 Tax=Goodea atripinnis TaxID=208336 RepID=A0ABV0NDD9_9TELE